MFKVEPVSDRDPLKEPVDAIFLSVDRTGHCTSHTDPSIIRRIDKLYGPDLKKQLPLQDGDMVVLDNPDRVPVYRHAVFCADFGERPVSVLTHFVLKEAENRKLRKVSLIPRRAFPVIVSHPMESLVSEIAKGIGNFLVRRPEHVEHVRVIFPDIGGPDSLIWYLRENHKISGMFHEVR